jgi:hypothetical protein
MTPSATSHDASTSRHRRLIVTFAMLWGACGARSSLTVSAKDAGDDDSLTPIGAGGASASGGGAARGSGGSLGVAGAPTGGRPSTGGAPGSAGSAIVGTGGRGGTGGSSAAVRDASPVTDAVRAGDAAPPGAPVIDPNTGYTIVATGTVTMNGYASSSASSGSSIGLTSTASSLCATGFVGASSAYSTWANASFAVNQAKAGSSGSTGSLPLVGTTMSVSYSNQGASPLEFQVWDGSNFWCYYLPASKVSTTATFPLSSLNTQCWSGQGNAFVSGTPITSIQLVVPGSATVATPFDYCFLGLTVQ